MTARRFLALSALLIACSSPPKPEPAPAAAPTASVEPLPSASPTSTEDASAAPPATAGETDPRDVLAAAKKEGKPAFLVFCAKWVAACGELSNTLGDAAVKKTLEERFVVARVDVSNDEDPTTRERMKRYNVKGLPLMIVFDRKGKEVARETSYVDSSKLAKLLEKAK